MPECLECEVLQKERCVNPLAYLPNYTVCQKSSNFVNSVLFLTAQMCVHNCQLHYFISAPLCKTVK